jgi:diguanylate cyclase (GGDEF)-like protein
MHRRAHAARAGPRFTRVTPQLLLALIATLWLAVPVYVLMPMGTLHQCLYVAVAALAVLLGYLGVRHHRPEHRAGWLLVLGGCAGWVLGDLTWTIEQHLLPDRYPAPSDAVYLCAYLALGAGSLVFVRTRRGGRDLAALLDASIITTGAAVLVGVFLIAPLADKSDLSLPAKLVSSAYPLADLFLLGVLARMYAANGARTLSYRLLTGAITLTLGADVAYDLAALVSDDTLSSRWTDAGWLTGYLLVAAAACVPSMKSLVEPAPDRGEATPTRRRLAALACGLMLPGVALLLDGAIGEGIHWQVVGVGTLLLSALVLVRMVGLLNIVQVQAVRLSALARSDSLTGAPNRRTWDHELPRSCVASRERGTTLCVAILDLDRFKAYNDTHGHQAGDRLLREAVAAWTEALPEDALLARYGGEEFAILVPGVGADEVQRMLHQLRAVTPGGQTFSAGVALWDPRTEPATAVAGADEALYAAKRAGRDRVVVHGQEPLVPAQHRPLPAFTMVTQPIVDITTGLVSSHEALARFIGPEGDGDVEAVFRKAHTAGDGDLLELAAIRAALDLSGRPARHDLYVNVSARAVTSERLLAGLPARLDGVVVELSEDPDDVELSKVADAVSLLRGRGARIALDDVGAGAQEFARLARLRPDIIKVDRSLVAGCAGDTGCTAVLRALVTYAGQLGLTVCAEGVEDIADLQHLAALGVTHAQGYLLARPGRTWPHQITVLGSAAFS